LTRCSLAGWCSTENSIQVGAELINVRDNTALWGEQYERKASDILTLQQQIAGDIADKLRAKLTGADKQAGHETGHAESGSLPALRERPF